MTVKDLAEFIKQKNYNEFCDACVKISPRALHYITNYINNFQDELYENASPEQFKKWRYALSAEAETEYLIKNNLDQYTLTEEEKQQACLI